MPRGIRGRTITQALIHIGLNEHQHVEVREHIGRYLRNSTDIYMASSVAIRRIAGKYMKTFKAGSFFSDEAGLRYRFSVDREHLEIELAVEEVMAAQQSYAIDTRHKRERPCPGCRYHDGSPELGSIAVEVAGPPVRAETSSQTLVYSPEADRYQRDRWPLEGRKRSRSRMSSLDSFLDDSASEDDPHGGDPDYSENPRKRQTTERSTPSSFTEHKPSKVREASQLGSADTILIRSAPPTFQQVSDTKPVQFQSEAHAQHSVARAAARPSAIMAPVVQEPQPAVGTTPATLKIGGRPYKCASMAQQAASLVAMIEWLVQEQRKVLEAQSETKSEYFRLALEFEDTIEERLLASGLERF